ncbi:MAG: hypothetical protein O3B86_07460 [Planctomycetota bacterium]|nr:hypothetical protein [Planctomycetota bacterium]
MWTPRDLDIVETLTRRVRLLTDQQIQSIWWPERGSLAVVHRRLGKLQSSRLLERTTINAQPVNTRIQPLACWTPGQPAPHAQHVSAAARQRWNCAAVPTRVYSASRFAANLSGSSALHFPRPEQFDHDLLLGQVYVEYRTNRSDEAARWVGEDALPKAGYRIKDPDAFLRDDAGRVVRIIESAGRYSPIQIESFHNHCRKYSVSYELW